MATSTSGRGDNSVYYASTISRNNEAATGVNVIEPDTLSTDVIVRSLQVVMDGNATPTDQWCRVIIGQTGTWAEVWGDQTTRVVELGPLHVPAGQRLRIAINNTLGDSIGWYVSYEIQ